MKKLLLSLLAVFAATTVSAQVALKPLSAMPKTAPDKQARSVEKMNIVQNVPLPKADGDLPAEPVTTRPEGRSAAYHLTGATLYNSTDGGMTFTASQVTNTDIGMEAVYEDDGQTVWLRNATMSTYPDIWIKGTLADGGKRILVEPGQMLGYQQGYTGEGETVILDVRLYATNYKSTNDGAPSLTSISPEPIPYVIDGDEIRLDLPEDGTTAIGGVMTQSSDDGTIAAYYSPTNSAYAIAFDRLEMQKTMLPAGLNMQDYIVSYTNDIHGDYNLTAKMGIDGQDIYLSGIFLGIEDKGVGVKGTFDGEKAVFPAKQLLTMYEGYWFYMQPCVQTTVDGQPKLERTDALTFTYDKETGTFSSDETVSIWNDIGGGLTVDGLLSSPTLSPLEAVRRAGRVENYQLSAATGYTYDGENGYSTFEVNPYVGMEIVYSNDGQTVWMKNIAPAPSANADVWTKGTLADGGKRILVKPGQMVGGSALLFAMTYKTEDGKVWPDQVVTDDIPYVIDGDEIRLDLPADGTMSVGALLIGDGTTYVSDPGMFGTTFKRMGWDRITPPEGLQTEDYTMTYGDGFGGEGELGVQVGIDGQDIYIGGLYENYASTIFANPENIWIKGTFDGEKAVFQPNQLLFLMMYWYYMQPWTPVEEGGQTYYQSIDELTFAYDAATRTYSTDDILGANVHNSFNTGMYFPYVAPKLTPAQSVGVNAVKAEPEGEAVKTEYFTLSGMKISKPQRGIYIKTVTYADGTRRSVKVAVK